MKLSTAFMTETFISAIKALPLTLSLALVPFLFGSVFGTDQAGALLGKICILLCLPDPRDADGGAGTAFV